MHVHILFVYVLCLNAVLYCYVLSPLEGGGVDITIRYDQIDKTGLS